MPGDTNFSMRMDSTLKTQAEEVLSELGMTMSGAFTMFLKQIVREQAVPLTLHGLRVPGQQEPIQVRAAGCPL